jgi:putative membrane protein
MHTHQEVASTHTPELIVALLFSLLILLYIGAVMFTNRHYKKWPHYRVVSWCIGMLLAAITVVGPLAERAHTDFTIHMLAHLLVGMLAPLLIVLSAPITLLLRTLSTRMARGVTKLLRSGPSRFITDPVVATMLNVGGLWVLYTTNLFALMHENSFVYVMVHVHVFLAGYVFTVSMIYIDPVYHRKSFIYRAVVLVIALAGHSILAKYLYAHPPTGVPIDQAEHGSMLMYYGGDFIDAVIIFILCLQWYKGARPRVAFRQQKSSNVRG